MYRVAPFEQCVDCRVGCSFAIRAVSVIVDHCSSRTDTSVQLNPADGSMDHYSHHDTTTPTSTTTFRPITVNTQTQQRSSDPARLSATLHRHWHWQPPLKGVCKALASLLGGGEIERWRGIPRWDENKLIIHQPTTTTSPPFSTHTLLPGSILCERSSVMAVKS